MKKVILVDELPDKCLGCDFYDGFCMATAEAKGREISRSFVYISKEEATTRPSWCPLKEMPMPRCTMDITEYCCGVASGWNECIEEMLK